MNDIEIKYTNDESYRKYVDDNCAYIKAWVDPDTNKTMIIFQSNLHKENPDSEDAFFIFSSMVGAYELLHKTPEELIRIANAKHSSTSIKTMH